MRYIVTIVNKITGTVSNLERDEKTINQTIDKELNGWNNLSSACTGGVNRDMLHKDEYFMAGVTKNDSHAFSILCLIN